MRNDEVTQSGIVDEGRRQTATGSRLPRHQRKLGAAIVLALIAVAAVLFWRLSREPVAPPPPRILVLYAYSVLEEAIREDLFPLFQDQWRRDSAETVELAATFAGSGAITQQILRKVPVELEILASEMDAHRLSPTVPWRSWEQLPHRGVLARTRLAFLVRHGNPLGISELSDLLRPGVAVVHADPESSGAGQWVVLGVYGDERSRTSSDSAAEQALVRLRENTVASPRSARDALRLFATGVGDVLPTYQQDLENARNLGALAGEIVRPTISILPEPVVVLASANVAESQRPLVEAFVRFLWSPEAQSLLARRGFESVLAASPTESRSDRERAGDLTLNDFGGAEAARRRILEGSWRRTALRN